ncbi:PREDICTED: prolactin-releasing peptide receptor-like [Priapulus caudatus]|uniref:Prolactin-releasing peptide receptor-like n=1 Tax=Priapulus caudatus TaxID=37621 RepID=A0ABM1ECA1_PRICU|nr:PREDICTED: prolactin-releasing peptide receptor-like [Priapulus caudatus]
MESEQPENATIANGTYYGIKEIHIQVMFYAAYAVIFIVGTAGNFLTCYVVVRNPAMQSVTNIFIANLAISDGLMCLISVPFTPLSTWLPAWYFGSVMCHLVPLIQAISVYVSTLTLTAIAVDRFVVICYPFKPRMKMSVCVLVLLLVWVISVSMSLPMGVYMTVDENRMCRENWPVIAHMSMYTMANLLVQFAFPLIIITFCYAMVSMRLSERVRRKMGSRTCRERDDQDIRRKRRTNRMLIGMVLIFAFCWLPLNTLHVIITGINERLAYSEHFLVTFSFCHVVAMSSTCYNPFIYAYLNDNFRKEFKSALSCCIQEPRQCRCNGNSLDTAQTTLVHAGRNSLRCDVADPETNSPANAHLKRLKLKSSIKSNQSNRSGELEYLSEAENERDATTAL